MFGVINSSDYLDNPEIDAETKLQRLRKEFEEYKFMMNFHHNPRDKYQQFLLAAKQVDCNVEQYIFEEVERMKSELDR